MSDAAGAPRWQATPRDGRVRIGLSRGQQLRWALVTGLVATVAGGAGVAAGRAALVVAVGVLAAVSLAYAGFAGVELAPSTLTVVAPSLRRRTLWTRTMRWTTVVDIRATGTGEIWLALPGEPALVLRAPRGRWLGRDPDFADKLRLIETWWRVNSSAALRETSSTPFERVQAALDGRGDRGPEPRRSGHAIGFDPPRPGVGGQAATGYEPDGYADHDREPGGYGPGWHAPVPPPGSFGPDGDEPTDYDRFVGRFTGHEGLDPGRHDAGGYAPEDYRRGYPPGDHGVPDHDPTVYPREDTVPPGYDDGAYWSDDHAPAGYDEGAHWSDGAAPAGYDDRGYWTAEHEQAVHPPEAPARPAYPGAGPWDAVGPAGTAPAAAPATTPPAAHEDEDEERTPFPVVAVIGFFLLAAAVGYLLIGRDIIVLAIALLVLLRFGRDPGRPLAMGAFALLVLAAISTVAQDRPGGVTLAYATEGVLAAEAGAVIGVFLVVSTIIFAVTERSGPRAVRRGAGGVDRVHLATLAAVLPAWVRAAVAYVAVALASLAIRLAFAPPALAAGYQPLLDNLRLGTGYSLARPSGGTPVGELPPLAPVLVAYSTLGARVALLVVSTLTVIGVGWVAHQRWGRAAGIMAAAFAALLPGLWGEQLPVQLAGLLLLAGVALADPRHVTTRRAALAGACLGLAALARPDAVVAIVIVALWLSRQRGEGSRGEVTALVVSATAVLLPWANFVWTEFGSPWLTSSLPATLNDPMVTSRLPSTIKVAVSAAFVAALAVAGARLWPRRGQLLPYLALPVIGVLLAFTEPLRRDPLAWSAPLAAVVLGRWAAEVIRGQLGPVLEVRYRDVVDWDIVFEEQQRKRGFGAGAWRSDAETPLEQEP